MANEQPVSQGRPAPFGQLHCASYAVPGPDNGRPAPFALFTSEECSSLSAPCDTTSLSAQRDLASLPAPCDGTGLPAQRDLSHAQHRVRDGATSSSVNIRNNSNWLIRDAHVPACDLCHLIQQLYCERAILWKWLYESVACDEQTEDHPAASSELVNGWPHHNNSPQSHSSSSAETVVVPDAWPCPASEPPPPVPAGVAGPPCPFPWAVVPPCQRLQQIDRELSKLRQLHYLTERDKAMKSVSSGSSSASAVGTATVRPRRPTEEFNGHAAPPLPHHAVPALSEGSVLLLQRESFMELLSKLPASIDLLLTLSTSPENCLALTHFSAIPVVVELIHDAGQGFSAAAGREVRDKAERVLNQLVISQIEDKRCRREVFVLRMLEKLRQYSARVLYQPQSLTKEEEDLPDAFPVPALSALCEKTFEADYRHTFSYLGGVQAVAEVLTVNFERYDHTTSRYHANIRKYACLILTNVTCGDGIKKAVLCTSRRFLDVLALLLTGGPEDLRGKTAAVVRNLSWKADVHSQEKLREAKIVPALLRALMKAEQAENHLVSMLCALNNLSAHCDENKNDMCAYEGALARLVGLLKHKPATDKLDVPENAGSVLYRLSKIIAHREDYRQILRDHQCLDILVEHLRSPHLGWVSNAVRIIWVLSSRSLEDQQHLWDVGAVTLLQTLSTSKYPAIAEGSGRAFRHLMAAVRGEGGRTRSLQSHASVPSSPLVARQERGHPANRSLRDFHRFRRTDVPPTQQQQPRPMMNLVDKIARQVAGGETQPSPPTSPVAPAHPATLYDADEPSDLDVPGTCDEFVDFTRKQPRQLDDYSAPETVTRFSTERTPKPRPGTAGTPLRSVLHTAAISTVGSRGSSPDSGPDVPTPAIRGGEDATEYNSCVASGTMSPSNLMTEMERDAFFDEIPPSPSLMNRSPRARTGRRRMLPTPPVERPGGRGEAGFKEDGVEEKPVVYKDEGLSKATSLSSIVSSCLVATHPPPKPPAPAARAPHPPLTNGSDAAYQQFARHLTDQQTSTPLRPAPSAGAPDPPAPVPEKKEEEERKPAQFNVLEGFAELKKKVAERKAIVDAESGPLVNGERSSEAEKNGKIVEKDKETGGFNVASSFALLMNSVNEKKAKAETPGKVEEPAVVVEKKPEEEQNPLKETTEKVEDEGYSEVSPKTEEKLKENGQKEEKPDGKKKVKEKSPSVEKKPLEPIAETAELPREVQAIPEPRPEPTASTSTVVEDDNKLLADCIYAAMPVRKPVHPVKTDKKRRPKPPNPRLAAAGKTSSRHRRIEDAMKRTASEGGCGSPAGHPPGSGSPAGYPPGSGSPAGDPPASQSGMLRSKSVGDRAGLRLELKRDEATSPLDGEEEVNGGRDGSSPDLGDLLDGRRECAVESRFTSEEEGDKEEAGRRPRIVKPVRSSGGSVDGGGKKAEKGRMKKSGMPTLPMGLKPPSIRGGGLVITHSAESSQGPASDSMEETAPMRIVKQGTFTKDRPSGMVPVILPDVGGSPNRKRYGSSVRGPPHRDPLPTSSPRKLTSTPSPRPSRYPHPKSNSFPGHDVISIPPPPPPDLSSSSFPPPTPSVAPKPHPPKKSTVSSKIASLWRGKEKKPDPPPLPREMKSPTLSERAAAPGARVWGSVLAGVSATLPKMRAAEVTTFRPRFAPLNGTAKREGTSEAEKDAGLTVTTV